MTNAADGMSGTPHDGAEARTVVVDVPDALDGQRIDRVVAMACDLARSAADERIAAGDVTIDGDVVTRRSTRVAAGQHLVVAAVPIPTGDVALVADPTVEFEVRYEDEHLAVIDKPAGLVVHPGAGHDSGTLAHGLLHRFPEVVDVGAAHRPGIVHRLDRDTSGLLVIARTAVALEALGDALRRRDVTRRYRTLAWGHLAEPRGLIDAPIARSPREPTKMAIVVGGKPARTTYEVVATYDEPVTVTELVCRLETGRTHQIRVHLQGLGHAVVGDGRYGGARESLPVSRQFLHAEHLAFAHPVTGEPIAVDSPLPDDLAAVLDGLH